MSGDEDATYVLLRRLLAFVEGSLERALRWAGFEPNGGGRPWIRKRP